VELKQNSMSGELVAVSIALLLGLALLIAGTFSVVLQTTAIGPPGGYFGIGVMFVVLSWVVLASAESYRLDDEFLTRQVRSLVGVSEP